MMDKEKQIIKIEYDNSDNEMKQYCESEMYLCDICDNVFTEVHLLINHNTLVHGLEEDDNLTYDCANCFSSFKDKSLFDLHLIRRQKELLHHLPLISLDNRQKSEENKNSNHHETSYYCDFCEGKFFMEAHLKKHIG